ncbi:MAG: ATP-binding protein [Candidatus Pacearchaeota archaeon]|jgi:predicted ATPase
MTKKYVLTGGPCCGKTTLINELANAGYFVLGEVARGVIEQRKDMPLDYQEHFTRQTLIFDCQVKLEEKISGDFAFLDRGIFDNFAYQMHLLGKVIPSQIELAKNHPRYDKVFVLERLPFENDGLRIEKGDDEAQKLHDLIFQQYESFGYHPISIPVMSIQDRVDFILNHVGGKR